MKAAMADNATPASVVTALYLGSKTLHVEAERSGIISDLLRGEASRDGYTLLQRNLLPAYQALERGLERHRNTSGLAALATYRLERSAALEADLIALGDGASVNPGCVLQTHLFHDRVMSMDQVTLSAGSALGPHGIVLPGASIGARTTVGPGSLVTRGDAVPADSRWRGNPIASWPAPAAGRA